MIFPVDGKRDNDWKLIRGWTNGHPAWDIAPIPAGSLNRPIRASQNVTVASKGYRDSLEGHWIQLRVGDGRYLYFGHMATASPLSLGAYVREGAQIGVMGMTGLATGVHTHHEVRLQHGPGRTLDPAEYYKQVLGGSMAKDFTEADVNTIAEALVGVTKEEIRNKQNCKDILFAITLPYVKAKAKARAEERAELVKQADTAAAIRELTQVVRDKQ